MISSEVFRDTCQQLVNKLLRSQPASMRSGDCHDIVTGFLYTVIVT